MDLNIPSPESTDQCILASHFHSPLCWEHFDCQLSYGSRPCACTRGQINNWPCAGMYRWVCEWITDGDYSLQGFSNPGEERAERSEEQEEGGDGSGMLTYHISWLLYHKDTPSVVACTGPTEAWACGDPLRDILNK